MRKGFTKKSIRFLFLFLFVPLWLSAQNVTVSGKVTDKTGEALVGVNVTEKGTTNGVASGVDGNYSLSVSRNATLEFKYIGYTPMLINVNGGGILMLSCKKIPKLYRKWWLLGMARSAEKQ
jgi:hypothetical protein